QRHPRLDGSVALRAPDHEIRVGGPAAPQARQLVLRLLSWRLLRIHASHVSGTALGVVTFWPACAYTENKPVICSSSQFGRLNKDASGERLVEQAVVEAINSACSATISFD